MYKLAFSLTNMSVRRPSPVVAKGHTKSTGRWGKLKQTKPEGSLTAVTAVSQATVICKHQQKRHRSRIARLHAIVGQRILKRRERWVDQNILVQADFEDLALVCTTAEHLAPLCPDIHRPFSWKINIKGAYFEVQNGTSLLSWV